MRRKEPTKNGNTAPPIPLNLLLHHRDLRLSSTQFVICLLLLAHQAKDPEKRCRPSMISLAKTLGVIRQSVKSHIDRMRKRGLVKVTPTITDSGSFGHNEYDLTPLLNKCDELARSTDRDRREAA